MNDLQTLGAALAQDEPAQDVVDRSRHRLQNRIRGGGSSFPKRTAWLTAGAGITVAAAVAVAVAVVPDAAPDDGPARTGAAPGETAPRETAPTKAVTGQEILLAAATAAEQAPDATGTYWYVKVTIEHTDGPTEEWETWTRPDGQEWLRSMKTNGQVQAMGVVNENPFSLVGVELTLDQLRALPTDPAALRAAIVEGIRNGDGRTSAGPLKDDPKFLAQAEFDSLISLVSTLPAPPALRAGAFRALATYPGVENLGPVPGGQGLRLPSGRRFVVDPRTGRVNGTETFGYGAGATYTVGEGGSARITAEWTDTLPS